MNPIKPSIAIVGAREEEDVIRAQIESIMDVITSEPEMTRALEITQQLNPDVVILFLDNAPEQALAATQEISKLRSCIPVVVSRNRDPEHILAAMRAGARDFAHLDENASDVRRALTDLIRIIKPSEPENAGKVLSVFSAKGGSGATSVACNLAGSLAHRSIGGRPVRVALLDFDLELGDVLVFLDLSAPFSYRDLIDNMHRMDADLLYRSLTQHSSGIYVMSQCDRVEEGQDLNGDDVATIIWLLRRYFDYIIIDGLRDFRDTALVALDKADQIIVTLTQDVPALRNTHRCLHLFHRLGYGGSRIKLVLNRYRRFGDPNVAAISDALQCPISATITENFNDTVSAINQGKLLVESDVHSRVSKDMGRLAEQFHPQAPAKRSRFPFFRGKQQ